MRQSILVLLSIYQEYNAVLLCKGFFLTARLPLFFNSKIRNSQELFAANGKFTSKSGICTNKDNQIDEKLDKSDFKSLRSSKRHFLWYDINIFYDMKASLNISESRFKLWYLLIRANILGLLHGLMGIYGKICWDRLQHM